MNIMVLGTPLNWIQSFLCGRTQYVEINGIITLENVDMAMGADAVDNQGLFG